MDQGVTITLFASTHLLLCVCSQALYVLFQTFFVDFRREITEKGLKLTKKVEKQLKKCFNQFVGGGCTQKLVKIYNIRSTVTVL